MENISLRIFKAKTKISENCTEFEKTVEKSNGEKINDLRKSLYEKRSKLQEEIRILERSYENKIDKEKKNFEQSKVKLFQKNNPFFLEKQEMEKLCKYISIGFDIEQRELRRRENDKITIFEKIAGPLVDIYLMVEENRNRSNRFTAIAKAVFHSSEFETMCRSNAAVPMNYNNNILEVYCKSVEAAKTLLEKSAHRIQPLKDFASETKAKVDELMKTVDVAKEFDFRLADIQYSGVKIVKQNKSEISLTKYIYQGSKQSNLLFNIKHVGDLKFEVVLTYNNVPGTVSFKELPKDEITDFVLYVIGKFPMGLTAKQIKEITILAGKEKTKVSLTETE